MGRDKIPDKTPKRPERPQQSGNEALTTHGARCFCSWCHRSRELLKAEEQKRKNQAAQYRQLKGKADASLKYCKAKVATLTEMEKEQREAAQRLQAENAALRQKAERLEQKANDSERAAAIAQLPADRMKRQREVTNEHAANVKARAVALTRGEKEQVAAKGALERRAKNLERRERLLDQRAHRLHAVEDAGAAAQIAHDAQVVENARLVRLLALSHSHYQASNAKRIKLETAKTKLADEKILYLAALSKKEQQLNASKERVRSQRRATEASRATASRLTAELSARNTVVTALHVELATAKSYCAAAENELEQTREQLGNRRTLLTTKSKDSQHFTHATLRYLRNLSMAGVPAAHHIDVITASEDFFDRKMSTHPSKTTSQREAKVAEVWELGHTAQLLDGFRHNVQKNGNLLYGR